MSSPAASLSLREARSIVHRYFVRRPALYWIDALCSLGVGYAAATAYLQASLGSAAQIASLAIASFALFRAGSFIHEIAHMRHGEMLGFRVFWNLACGVPMLMPSFFYQNHIDHHKSDHYGTERDGEYIALGTSHWTHIPLFFSQALFLPGYVYLRFLLSPITFSHPRLRLWTLEHCSSFVFNFRHRLTIPETAPRRVWASIETACFMRSAAMLGLVATGLYPWTRLAQLYVLAMSILGLNYLRNLVAHHYRGDGRALSHAEQLADSVNISGGWLTELFFPLGLRYHALHHLFPSLPYHNLPAAHRALMAETPVDSLYRQTVYPSFWSVLGELLRDARRSKSGSQSAAAGPPTNFGGDLISTADGRD